MNSYRTVSDACWFAIRNGIQPVKSNATAVSEAFLGDIWETTNLSRETWKIAIRIVVYVLFYVQMYTVSKLKWFYACIFVFVSEMLMFRLLHFHGVLSAANLKIVPVDLATTYSHSYISVSFKFLKLNWKTKLDVGQLIKKVVFLLKQNISLKYFSEGKYETNLASHKVCNSCIVSIWNSLNNAAIRWQCTWKINIMVVATTWTLLSSLNEQCQWHGDISQEMRNNDDDDNINAESMHVFELCRLWCFLLDCCARFPSANSTSCDTTLRVCWRRWKSWKNERFWKFKNDNLFCLFVCLSVNYTVIVHVVCTSYFCKINCVYRCINLMCR